MKKPFVILLAVIAVCAGGLFLLDLATKNSDYPLNCGASKSKFLSVITAGCGKGKETPVETDAAPTMPLTLRKKSGASAR